MSILTTHFSFQFLELVILGNKIKCFDSIKHHQYFPVEDQDLFDIYEEYEEKEEPRYFIHSQKASSIQEVLFYNKILSIHNSHKQINQMQKQRKNDQKNSHKLKRKNLNLSFTTFLEQKKNQVSAMLNNQILMLNKQVELLVQFIQNSNSYLD
ncbi:Hypothetical_protein [Hexamita inflata]|uniref:Hypothetical_protein n=1 Tax=Hexamita inflata TaxID=28002 RepID=A0AA86VIR5_9EUKA|nr:Hypothetical protein HINF_LOCUS55488 [Hexamita inflata]